MTAFPDLTFREDYFADPAGWVAIKSLILDIFDVDIAPLDRHGSYDPSCMPSAYFDEDGNCVANLTAFSMPIILNGRVIRATGWQSGAVRPPYRGRGLFRDLIERTIARCEAVGFEAILLYTDKPGLYQPHGFRMIPQYRFEGQAPAPIVPDALVRQLDVRNVDDAALVTRMLAERMPVSGRLAVTEQGRMFLLNCHLVDDVRLTLIEERQALVAWRLAADGVPEILDVVAQRLPPLASLMAAIGKPASRVRLFIPPDRLDWTGEALPEMGEQVLMMRSAAHSEPVTPSCLSPMAEF
ncbi:GNAT family N-acetyltransferase [Rhizobium alvei]|uniref:GNAT family N-acetyltransferase n=1 Tax=Rhizobium alvei TaxID=1132659 RepID=A0ABT8YPI5_9HYPH|nr:GNAT family N-acetyltransferase [Rhizobium alvei]MDO6965615.1 GNAT family N-acetyltransferase [Rhizobium alvei]